MVEVTCPMCNKKRMRSAYDVARRIREGRFDGRCLADSTIGKMRKDNRIGRPPHPSVDWTRTQVMVVGKQRTNHVHVTCPHCGEERWCQVQTTAIAINKGSFTGKCVKCGSTFVAREPAFVHCRYCGKMARLAGASLLDQELFELRSGLRIAS